VSHITVTAEEFDKDPKIISRMMEEHESVTVLDSKGQPSMTLVCPRDVLPTDEDLERLPHVESSARAWKALAKRLRAQILEHNYDDDDNWTSSGRCGPYVPGGRARTKTELEIAK
jgi:hypothetical protein